MAALAQRDRTTFFEALRRADQAPAMATRSVKAIDSFVRMMDDLAQLNQDEKPSVVLEAVLEQSGMMERCASPRIFRTSPARTTSASWSPW